MKRYFWYIAIILFTAGLYLADCLEMKTCLPGDSSAINSISDSDFYRELHARDGTLCILYYSEESPHYRRMESNLVEVSEEAGRELSVYKIDVDDYPSLSCEQQLSGTPTLVLYRGGRERSRIFGKVSPLNIRMILKRAAR